MRTTITIDDDLIRDLKRTAIEQRVPFKGLLGAALRAGLQSLRRRPPGRPFRGHVFSMGNPTGIDLDKASAVAAEIEDEEVVRKLALRK